MFTGLVEARGKLTATMPSDQGLRVALSAPFANTLNLGESVCTSGVCLSVTGVEDDCFWADVMPETLRCTTLGKREIGDELNLERALRADTRLGGHIVAGHVDAVGTVTKFDRGGKWATLRVSLPRDLAGQVAMKGSIAVDGTSLTVSGVGEDWFEVSIIPQTLHDTTLGALAEGDQVNLETDVLAKYVARLMEVGQN